MIGHRRQMVWASRWRSARCTTDSRTPSSSASHGLGYGRPAHSPPCRSGSRIQIVSVVRSVPVAGTGHQQRSSPGPHGSQGFADAGGVGRRPGVGDRYSVHHHLLAPQRSSAPHNAARSTETPGGAPALSSRSGRSEKALIPAMIAPASVTEANERKNPVWKKRPRIQASVRSSKATVMTATISAAPYCGMRKGSVCKMPPRKVPTPVIEPHR
jgi:hypothetical protein